MNAEIKSKLAHVSHFWPGFGFGRTPARRPAANVFIEKCVKGGWKTALKCWKIQVKQSAHVQNARPWGLLFIVKYKSEGTVREIGKHLQSAIELLRSMNI